MTFKEASRDTETDFLFTTLSSRGVCVCLCCCVCVCECVIVRLRSFTL